MPIVYATASIPGSLYIDGTPIATLEETPQRLSLGPEGAHLFYAPHRAGFLPIAHKLDGGQAQDPSKWQGLKATIWPGGTVEIHLTPLPAMRAAPIASAGFSGGEANLYALGQIYLETPGGQSHPIGEGQQGGLHVTPLGHLAAFATGQKEEYLRILAPGADGQAQTLLHIKGQQILLSAEGTRVRVKEAPLPGMQTGILREYVYQPSRASFLQQSVQAEEGEPSITLEMAPYAMVSAILAGQMDQALALLTPSLRSVVDETTLTAFLGPFDRCVQARHTPTMAGVQTLALLRPQGDAHIARVLAFEVLLQDGQPRIDNIRAWEGE